MTISEATLLKNVQENLIQSSFAQLAPYWPLKNLIAVNPLQGLEDWPIEEGLKMGMAYFQQAELPKPMQAINRETMKWMQIFCDEGQSTLGMPLRQRGLYAAWRQLVIYDDKLHGNRPEIMKWLALLPESADQAVLNTLSRLNIAAENHQQFLTLLLTTLPGWASYVKYRTEWPGLDRSHPHPLAQSDYLAIRIIITCVIWPQAEKLLDWHTKALLQSHSNVLEKIDHTEKQYRSELLTKLAMQSVKAPHIPEAQWIFCIDVRSEPMRRALEAAGDYQTFGFAGFFGIPTKITDTITERSYAACPVLLSPVHEIPEQPCSKLACDQAKKNYIRIKHFKTLYQSLKYNLTTPFALVETLGFFSGLWMGLKTLFPSVADKIRAWSTNAVPPSLPVKPCLDSMTFEQRCMYAEQALRMIGLTRYFAPRIIVCGHESATQNNAYATALDCGACGGHSGASNARILAEILNSVKVRDYLRKSNILIPETTQFIAASHNTTTDEIVVYNADSAPGWEKLNESLAKARAANNLERLHKMNVRNPQVKDAKIRSQDWAQVRPEWGLARNAAFIAAPRDITAELNLNGRCFLHSYEYTQDPDNNVLTTILTAPMVVAQWINMQYLFSTFDNVAYGGGSKITKNITGKMGVIQGNASDLMTGLPLQSVCSTDTVAYHELQRLLVVVFAPRQKLDNIIHQQSILKKLFGNGWIQLAVIEPDDRIIYLLNRDFSWTKMQ